MKTLTVNGQSFQVTDGNAMGKNAASDLNMNGHNILSIGTAIAGKVELEVVRVEGSRVVYAVDALMEHTGSYDAALRVFPKNSKLPHRMDFALVKWA